MDRFTVSYLRSIFRTIGSTILHKISDINEIYRTWLILELLALVNNMLHLTFVMWLPRVL